MSVITLLLFIKSKNLARICVKQEYSKKRFSIVVNNSLLNHKRYFL